MSATLLWVTPIGYAMAAVIFLAQLWTQNRRLVRVGPPVLHVTLLLHATGLGLRYLVDARTPVSSFPESLILFSFLLSLVYAITRLRYPLNLAGAFVTPLSLVLLLAALFSHGDSAAVPVALRSVWLPIHVSMAFLGDIVLVLASVTAALYLIQHVALKAKRPNALVRRLPPLETLDQLSFRFIVFGFPLLTLGIITGSLWARHSWGRYWSWDPRETWSLITWFLYGAILHARLIAGWRGRRAALLTVLAFVILLGSFIGLKLAGVGQHVGEFR